MRSPVTAKTKLQWHPLHRQQPREPGGTALAQQASVSSRQKCEYEMFPCEHTPFLYEQTTERYNYSIPSILSNTICGSNHTDEYHWDQMTRIHDSTLTNSPLGPFLHPSPLCSKATHLLSRASSLPFVTSLY